MPTVYAKDDKEPIDSLVRRIKRLTEKAGLIKELKKREFHERGSQKRKREAAAARKRHLKKVSRSKALLENIRHAQSRKKSFLSKKEKTIIKEEKISEKSDKTDSSSDE